MYCYNSIRLTLVYFFLFFTPPLWATGFQQIRVEQIQGDVYTRRANQMLWYKLKKGNRLNKDWLLNVSQNASITLALGYHQNKKIIYKDLVRIQSPTILRLDERVLKNWQNQEYILRNFPKLQDPKSDSKDPTQSILEWAQAWKQTVISLIDRSSLEQVADQDLKVMENKMLYSARKYPIPIYSPQMVDLVKINSDNDQWHIRWGESEAKEYIVYFWTDGDLYKKAYAKTSLNHYTVPIQPGTYYSLLQ